jgi:hypothetical protein
MKSKYGGSVRTRSERPVLERQGAIGGLAANGAATGAAGSEAVGADLAGLRVDGMAADPIRRRCGRFASGLR